ncbi:ComEC/Rec2 family competence protein [Nocardia lijiangensis]|uniref:ComEC/Rec2 family competence protein n=1 Tax=Nocardia lijiangensis TaxID=299618 RepID=UPI000830BDD6|nr:ComEC/Rec2 family competence protein [Nocardia lijiangensis]
MTSSLGTREPEVADARPTVDARLLPAALCCWAVTIVVLISGWSAGIAVALGLLVTAVGVAATVLPAHFTRRQVVTSILLLGASPALVAGFPGGLAVPVAGFPGGLAVPVALIMGGSASLLVLGTKRFARTLAIALTLLGAGVAVVTELSSAGASAGVAVGVAVGSVFALALRTEYLARRATACTLLVAGLCGVGAVAVAGVGAGMTVAVAVVVVSVLAAVVSEMRRRGEGSEGRRAVALTLLAAVLLGAGFAVAAAWREHRVATHPMREVYGLSMRVVVTPTDDPKPVRGSSFGGERRWIVRAALREYRNADATVRSGGRVVILASGPEWGELLPGQPIEFRAQPQPPKNRDLTVAALHAVGLPKPVAAPPWWQRAAASVRHDFAGAATAALPSDAAGLLPALVLGDTSGLPEPVRQDFETSGLQHLCVVSGANFTILLSVVLFVVRALTLGPRAAAMTAAAALLMFVVVARPDPSVLRAAAMGAVTLLALVTGRRRQALPALCAAVIGLLLVWPELAVNAGFALSVLATAGLILLAPSWADWLRAHGWWRLPAEVVAVSAAAFAVTVPIMVAMTGRVSVVAILANVLVAPVIAPLTVVGALGAACASAWSPLAELVLRCAGPPSWWLLKVAEHTAALPGATITVPGGPVGGLTAAALVIVTVWALRAAMVRRLATVVVLAATAVLLPARLWHPGWPPSDWILAACDIGQGDGLALAAGPGTAVVIDVGPDPRTMRACLDRLRIRHIALLALTHPHADHIGGLTGAIHGRTVAAIATAPGELVEARPSAELGAPERNELETTGAHYPPAAHPDSTARPTTTPATDAVPPSPGGTAERRRVTDERTPLTGAAQVAEIAGRTGIPLLELTTGHVLRFGAVELTVLAPADPGPHRPHSADEPNDRSLVITATTPAGRILLTGDIESTAQLRLLRDPALLHADILKVPHHGSRTTTKEFLAAVHPRLAIISSGADNTFGHPHPTILADLQTLGATIARTDLHGDILIAGGPSDLRVITRGPP